MRLAMAVLFLAAIAVSSARADEPAKDAGKESKEVVAKTVIKGAQAPALKIKDSQGKDIDLVELSKKGPVLVRLTCGCSGCDKELAYFQALDEAYKGQGLTSIAIFREPDSKVEGYVKEKKLNMLYAVDTKGETWNVFQTKTMPANFLIAKGGKIISIAEGCDPSGLLANKVAADVAKALETKAVDVKKEVNDKASK